MVFLKIFKKHSDPDASSFTNTVSYSAPSCVCLSLVFQWLSSPGSVGAAYLGYRWLLATLVTFGLLQSLYQNTAYFLGRGETENVFKYFIYLTNNGRWVQRVQ